MSGDSGPISEFWKMFQELSNELAAIPSADHPVYDSILERLQRIHPELYFEFSSGDESSELVLTAEGDQSLFALVDSIVAQAPEVPGWTIVSLKPKLGFPVSTRWEGTSVTIADVVFDPLEREGSDDLGLRMYVPGLADDSVDDAHNALLRALDHALGEREFAESVQFTEVARLPDGVSANDFIPLVDLEKYVEWRKSRKDAD